MQIDILSYLPEVVSDVYEFQLIAEAENAEFAKLWDGCRRALDNQFCETLDETGAKRFEKMLGLNSDGDIAFRRFKIKTAMGSRVPFTKNALILQLNSICGDGNYELQIDYTLQKISVYLTSTEHADEVKRLLSFMAPANMEIEVSLLYRRYSTVESFKHSELSELTHIKIKEGEMI